MRESCERIACFNPEKKSHDVGFFPLMQLALEGVVVAKTARGFVSAVHTEEDIRKTIKAFDITLDTMISQGLIKPR